MTHLRIICLLVIALSGLARAEHVASRTIIAAGSDRENMARKIRAAADEQFVAARFDVALEGYRRAIAYWDHPKLHFSAGLCYLELREWAAAADSFETALAFTSGLTTREVSEARDYLASATSKTATLELDSRQGAAIFLDGKPITGLPHVVRVLPGPHVVIATRGDLSATETVEVAARERKHVAPEINVVLVRSRWARWKPWALTGAGLAVAAAAVPMFYLERDRLDAATALAQGCIGCDRGDAYDHARDRASTYRRLGIAALGVGGAVTITGLILVAANRTTQERRSLPLVAVSSGQVALGWSGAW